MQRKTRRQWLWISISIAVLTAAAVVPLAALADRDEAAFTATLYSDVIRFEADGVASLRVTIYDLSENELWNSALVMGDFVDWDRVNARGERLANGLYLYLAQGWDAGDRLVLNKTGKVVLLPGDQVELKVAPVDVAPAIADGDRDDPIMSPMTQTINDSLTVRETSGNTYLNVDTPGSGLQSVLYWKENGTGRASMFFNPGGDVLSFKTYGADDIAFLLNNTERFRMTNSGRMQVTNPSGNVYLDVSAPSGFQPVLYWKEGGVGRASMFYDPAGSELNFKTYGSDAITFVTSGYDRMSVHSNGNVGIGTTTPSDKLTVNGGSVQVNDFMPTLELNDTDATGDLWQLGGWDAGASGARFEISNASDGYSVFYHEDGRYNAFNTADVEPITAEFATLNLYHGSSHFTRLFLDNGAAAADPWEILLSTGDGAFGIATDGSYQMRFWDPGSNDEVEFYCDLEVYGDIRVAGGGTKYFVADHPTDPSKQIVYAALEGPEAGTYLRGEAQLDNGEAVIDFPEHFGLVTAEDGLTVQLTPIGGWAPLYVVEVSTARLIVRCNDAPDAEFYYHVNGIRLGYEDFEVIRDKSMPQAGASYGAGGPSSAEAVLPTYQSGGERERE